MYVSCWRVTNSCRHWPVWYPNETHNLDQSLCYKSQMISTSCFLQWNGCSKCWHWLSSRTFKWPYDKSIFNPSHAVHDLSRVRQYVPWLLFTIFVNSVGYPRYNPQKTRKQWCTRDRRFQWLWGWFPDLKIIYDVIKLTIIESLYFPKEKVKVGLEKSKQNGGQLNVTKRQWISSVDK